MKKFFLIILVTSLGLNAQETNDYSSKVKTLDSTIATLYSVISGDKSEERNWELFKHLFKKDAKLIATGKNSKGKKIVKHMSPEDYIKTSGKWLVENGFHEIEINRKTQIFGNIAHVFSTYEAYQSLSDNEPMLRGINSIQLFHDGKRWWIINVFWKQESETDSIPERYLPKD